MRVRGGGKGMFGEGRGGGGLPSRKSPMAESALPIVSCVEPIDS